MKKSTGLLMATVAMVAFSGAASAQETDQATATATMVAPIAIAKTIDMNFGNVAVASTGGGTVVLDPAGARTTTGDVTLPATSGTVAAASFDVTGEGTYTYAITLPSTAHTLTETVGGTATMDVTTFTSTPSGTGALSAGAQTLTVGATLNVTAGQAAGTYENATGFDVTVNYN